MGVKTACDDEDSIECFQQAMTRVELFLHFHDMRRNCVIFSNDFNASPQVVTRVSEVSSDMLQNY